MASRTSSTSTSSPARCSGSSIARLPPRAEIGSTENVFVHNRPGAAREIRERLQMIGCSLTFGRLPRRLHGVPVVPVQLDDSIPPGMRALRIRKNVVLDVASQAGNALSHGAMLVPQVGEELFR